MSTSGVGNTLGTSAIATSTASMSIEDAMMLVQMDRVKLCESQLQDQIAGIRDKNEQMKKLNDMKAQLLVLKSNFSADAKDTDTLYNKGHWLDSIGTKDVQPVAKDLANKWKESGLEDANPSYSSLISSGKITKAQVDAAEQVIKGQLDSLSSSSQMDMVRLQSLNNKRSEAFDTMTNMLKKAADGKSSVVSNFR